MNGANTDTAPTSSSQRNPKGIPLQNRGTNVASTSKEALRLRKAVLRRLNQQGYSLKQGVISPPGNNKDSLRHLQLLAVQHKRVQSGRQLKGDESLFLHHIANGTEVDPEKILPRLVEVKSRSFDERLFRYVALHWSIPVSSGYGRRIRFLVRDRQNGKVIGLIGLSDPVFALQQRDAWIGWDHVRRREALYHVMDAFVLGAVPPYSQLLGGKLIALLALSNPVQSAFRRKYNKRKSLISGRRRKPELAMITTTSALGRSSIYNRLRYENITFWRSVGFTEGYGQFHFSNGVYDRLHDFAKIHCTPSARNTSWGEGFRNKREVLKKALPLLGLSKELLRHGVKREIFLAPLAKNAADYLKGDDKRLFGYNWSVPKLFSIFRSRWLLPRAARCPEYANFNRKEFRLWGTGE